jgi:hypothetical protein
MPSLDAGVAPASVRLARRGIYGMAALFALKAAILAFWVTPLWDVPDEVGHYALIADIADGRGLALPGKSVIPEELARDWATRKNLAPEERWNWVAQHPPLYHLAAVPFLALGRLATSDREIRYRAPRLLSVFSGAGALLVFFETFLEAGVDPGFAFFAASSVGFVPMFSHMSSGTNHDVFLALWCGVAALFWTRLTRSGNFTEGLRMSLALSLASAVKLSAVVVTAALLVISFRLLNSGGARRWRQWLAMGAVSICLPALWAVRQWILLGNARLHPVSGNAFRFSSFFAYLRDDPVVDHTFKNFVGLIGWTGTGGGELRWFQISGIFLGVFIGLALAAAIATACWLWGLRGPGRRLGQLASLAVFVFAFLWLFSGPDGSAPPKRLLYSVLAALPFLAVPRLFSSEKTSAFIPLAAQAVFLLFTLAYLVNSWEAYQIYGHMRATNGRYFFAILPFLVFAFLFPVARLNPSGPGRNAVLAAVLALLFLNETAFFLLRVVPFYQASTG